MKDKIKLLIEYNVLKRKFKKLKMKYEELQANHDFIFAENAMLKKANRKRYITQEEKMKFLIKRENKLQMIEQLVNKHVIDIEELVAFVKGDL